MAGPLIGGLLVDSLSWRFIFAINVLPIAVALWLMLRLGKDELGMPRPRVDYVGAALGVAGLGGPVYALIEQERLGWTSPMIYLPLAIGLASLVAFIWWESRAREPMMPLGVFRIRNFGMGNIATLFIYAAFGFGPFVISVFVQQFGGYTSLEAGLATLPTVLMLILLSSVFGRLSDRIGPRPFMTAGPLLCAAGFLLMLMVTSRVFYWTELLPGVVVLGLGMAITVAPLTTAILGAVDPAHAGIGSAINNAVARIAGLIAIASTGIIVGTQLDLVGFHRAVIATAILLAIGAAVSFTGIRNPDRTGKAEVPATVPAP